MNVTNFPNFYNIQQKPAQQATPMAQIMSMLNDKAKDSSPLEAAKQALFDAKAKLDEHRNEQIENALGGYRALRSRQTSYESELDVQQKQLENFRALSSRRDELTGELSSATADYEAYTATETTLDITQHSCSAGRSPRSNCATHSISCLSGPEENCGGWICKDFAASRAGGASPPANRQPSNGTSCVRSAACWTAKLPATAPAR